MSLQREFAGFVLLFFEQDGIQASELGFDRRGGIRVSLAERALLGLIRLLAEHDGEPTRRPPVRRQASFRLSRKAATTRAIGVRCSSSSLCDCRATPRRGCRSALEQQVLQPHASRPVMTSLTFSTVWRIAGPFMTGSPR